MSLFTFEVLVDKSLSCVQSARRICEKLVCDQSLATLFPFRGLIFGTDLWQLTVPGEMRTRLIDLVSVSP
jgi:hypothetical protein